MVSKIMLDKVLCVAMTSVIVAVEVRNIHHDILKYQERGLISEAWVDVGDFSRFRNKHTFKTSPEIQNFAAARYLGANGASGLLDDYLQSFTLR